MPFFTQLCTTEFSMEKLCKQLDEEKGQIIIYVYCPACFFFRFEQCVHSAQSE
jgi:hypothetical protein